MAVSDEKKSRDDWITMENCLGRASAIAEANYLYPPQAEEF